MIILSFDVGVKNLAYCLIDSITKDILDWNIIDCTSSNLILKLITELDSLNHLLESELILIEKQPSFNPKMRIMSTAIFVYFTLRINHERNKNIKIFYYSAKHKLKLCEVKLDKPCKTKYANNKKIAIEQTKILLNGNPFLNYFLSYKKKDDLADCYLQALSYIK